MSISSVLYQWWTLDTHRSKHRATIKKKKIIYIYIYIIEEISIILQ